MLLLLLLLLLLLRLLSIAMGLLLDRGGAVPSIGDITDGIGRPLPLPAVALSSGVTLTAAPMPTAPGDGFAGRIPTEEGGDTAEKCAT